MYGEVENIVERMKLTVLAPSVGDVSYNTGACDKYGGCPYKDRCPAHTLPSFMDFMSDTVSDPQQEAEVLDVMEEIRKRKAAQAGKTTAPTDTTTTTVGTAALVTATATVEAKQIGATGVNPPDAAKPIESRATETALAPTPEAKVETAPVPAETKPAEPAPAETPAPASAETPAPAKRNRRTKAEMETAGALVADLTAKIEKATTKDEIEAVAREMLEKKDVLGTSFDTVKSAYRKAKARVETAPAPSALIHPTLGIDTRERPAQVEPRNDPEGAATEPSPTPVTEKECGAATTCPACRTVTEPPPTPNPELVAAIQAPASKHVGLTLFIDCLPTKGYPGAISLQELIEERTPKCIEACRKAEPSKVPANAVDVREVAFGMAEKAMVVSFKRVPPTGVVIAQNTGLSAQVLEVLRPLADVVVQGGR